MFLILRNPMMALKIKVLKMGLHPDTTGKLLVMERTRRTWCFLCEELIPIFSRFILRTYAKMLECTMVLWFVHTMVIPIAF